jgi:hypothetical protein
VSRAIVVAPVGSARGSGAAAAALAGAICSPEETGLLVDLAEERPPRPSLISTARARSLEERLAAHLPETGVAARGETCRLTLPAGAAGVDRLPGVLAIGRDAVVVIRLPSDLLQPVLADPRIRPSGALLRADLTDSRALTALVAGDLIRHGLRVAVLKRPLGPLAARCALLGVPAAVGGGLPTRLTERLLAD